MQESRHRTPPSIWDTMAEARGRSSIIQPNLQVLRAVVQPEPTLQYDQSYIGASTSKLDRSKVFEACAIVEGVTPSGGTKKKPKLSIKDIREALDERGAEFLFDEFRNSSVVKMKRFQRSFADANNGDPLVNSSSLKRYLEAALIKALASVNERTEGEDGQPIVGESSISLSNFGSNFLKPVIALYWNQNQMNENAHSFPVVLSRMIRKARGLAKLHLPRFNHRETLCPEFVLHLIDIAPAGASWYFEFCFFLALLVLCGKRVGVLSRLRLVDLDEVIKLSHPDATKTMEFPHFLLGFTLSRDKGESHASPLTVCGSNAKRPHVLDPVYWFEQLLVSRFCIDLEQLKQMLDNRLRKKRGEVCGSLPNFFFRRLFCFGKKNTLNRLIKKLIAQNSNIDVPLNISVHSARTSAVERVSDKSENGIITTARFLVLKNVLGHTSRSSVYLRNYYDWSFNARHSLTALLSSSPETNLFAQTEAADVRRRMGLNKPLGRAEGKHYDDDNLDLFRVIFEKKFGRGSFEKRKLSLLSLETVVRNVQWKSRSIMEKVFKRYVFKLSLRKRKKHVK